MTITKYLVLSDLHANLAAVEAVLDYAAQNKIDRYIVLGDLIDYGMRPNEVISALKSLGSQVDLMIAGNHEDCYFKKDYQRFSSDRGRASAVFTEQVLTNSSRTFLESIRESAGFCECAVNGLKYLFVHGSINDPFWGKIDLSVNADLYRNYDIVISGHTHKSHDFFKKSISGKEIRFVNCGSVGQPRNGNPQAQFLQVDFQSHDMQHCAIDYDIEFEQSLYNGSIDDYYKNRLSLGV